MWEFFDDFIWVEEVALIKHEDGWVVVLKILFFTEVFSGFEDVFSRIVFIKVFIVESFVYVLIKEGFIRFWGIDLSLGDSSVDDCFLIYVGYEESSCDDLPIDVLYGYEVYTDFCEEFGDIFCRDFIGDVGFECFHELFVGTGFLISGTHFFEGFFDFLWVKLFEFSV